jgi:hypothetical protein
MYSCVVHTRSPEIPSIINNVACFERKSLQHHVLSYFLPKGKTTCLFLITDLSDNPPAEVKNIGIALGFVMKKLPYSVMQNLSCRGLPTDPTDRRVSFTFVRHTSFLVTVFHSLCSSLHVGSSS